VAAFVRKISHFYEKLVICWLPSKWSAWWI